MSPSSKLHEAGYLTVQMTRDSWNWKFTLLKILCFSIFIAWWHHLSLLWRATVAAVYDLPVLSRFHQCRANNTSVFQDIVGGHTYPWPLSKHRPIGLQNGPNAVKCHFSHDPLWLMLQSMCDALGTVVCYFSWWHHTTTYNQWLQYFCFLFPKPFQGFSKVFEGS